MISEPRVEHRQREHRVRLEWGVHGAELLAAECAVVVAFDTSTAAPRLRDGTFQRR